MIVETFLFNGQYELLQLKLNYMYDKIDKFYIVEGNRTFSGCQKITESYFAQADKHFDISKYLDKIQYKLFDAKKFMENHNLKPIIFLRPYDITSWYIENQIKIQFWEYAKQLYNNKNDQLIFIVSDLDEIFNMKKFNIVKKYLNLGNYIVRFKNFLFFTGKFNRLKSLNESPYMKICDAKYILNNNLLKINDWKYSFNQHLFKLGRVTYYPKYLTQSTMGWHFNNVMSEKQLKRKGMDFSHHIDIVIENNGNFDNWVKKALNADNIKKVRSIYDWNFPKQFIEIMEKYPYLIDQNNNEI